MHLLPFLIFLLPAAAEVSTFSLPVRRRQTNGSRNGPAALRDAYRKHGIPVPPHVQNAARNRENQIYALRDKQPHAHSHHGHQPHQRRQGSVVSHPSQWDIEYLSPVTVGNQTLQLNLDTGSADLWVFSSDLDPAIVKARPRGVYTPTATAVNTTNNWSISYSDGSFASGRVVLDSVSVGNTTVASQAVEMAGKVSNTFIADEECDGILGMAFSSINTVRPTPQKTFFENALSKLPQGLFTVDFRHDSPGSVDFGFINETKYTGNITFVPLRNGSGFWQFQTSSAYYIDNVKKWAQPMSRGALADTGTTLLLMSEGIVSTYYKNVKGSAYSRSQGGYVFPCTSTLPALGISFNTSIVPVNGSLLNFGRVSQTLCYGGLQSVAAGYPSVYGDIFFKAGFAIFDYANHRFGFAMKSNMTT